MAAKTSRRKHGAARQAKRAAAGSNGRPNGHASATNGLNGKQTSGLVFVINMIPRSLSGETSQDSEPHLTVNPSNRKQIVGTAFTPDPAGGPRAPIYISPNAGLTWKLNSIVPSVPGSIGTADITTGFSGKSSRLYAGILNAGNIHLQFLRTLNPFTPTPMTVLSDRANADQPFTHATKKGGKEHVYIGDNDFNAPAGKTETLDESLNAGVPAPAFSSIRVEKRTTLGQDGPQTRPASHPDGTVYAGFYRWRSASGSFPANTLVITSADVVVVRDDKAGGGSPPFSALVDPGDLVVGRRVVTGVSFPFMIHGTAATGQQRLGGSISVAVDPKDSSTVYLVWGDRQPGSVLTLHLRVSKDRGADVVGGLSDDSERDQRRGRRHRLAPDRLPVPADQGHGRVAAVGDASAAIEGRRELERSRSVQHAVDGAREDVRSVPRRLRSSRRGRQRLLWNLCRQQHAGLLALPERRVLPAQRELHHAPAAEARRHDGGGAVNRSVLLPGQGVGSTRSMMV